MALAQGENTERALAAGVILSRACRDLETIRKLVTAALT